MPASAKVKEATDVVEADATVLPVKDTVTLVKPVKATKKKVPTTVSAATKKSAQGEPKQKAKPVKAAPADTNKAKDKQIEKTQADNEAQVETKTVIEQPKPNTAASQPAQRQRKPKKKFSKSDHIKNQANPSSILVGRQKTITLRYEYCSDILHEYLQMNQSTMLAAYERLAGLLRLVATDKPSYTHVNEWITTNLAVCQEQVNTMQAQRAALADDYGDEVESLQVSVPDDYHTEFHASHPVCHKMLAVLKLIDAELNASEDLFLAGVIDDASFMSLRTQATSIIRGSVDRIYKATSPGMREGGRFTPSQLANWIRGGNKMLFADVPKSLEHLVTQKD